MAPKKRKAAPSPAAAAAPISAVAARKAREQAQAQASTSNTSDTPSKSRASRRSGNHHDEPSSDNDDSGVYIEIPLPTSSQDVSFEAARLSPSPSPSTDEASSSALKRPRKSSSAAAPHPTSIAASRPRRNSTAASAGPSTPRPATSKATSATPKKSPQSGSAERRSVYDEIPVSASKKKEAQRKADMSDDDDDDDSELERDIQAILAEYNLEDIASRVEASEVEQAPPKKRAKQQAQPRTPARPRTSTVAEPSSSSRPKRTPVKRKGAEEEPTETTTTTPPKKTPRKPSSKQVDGGASARSESKAKDSTASNKGLTRGTIGVDEARVRDAKRYFADMAKKHGKTHVGPSAMPVEDEDTGFLAFGDDDDGDESDAVSGDEDEVQNEAEQVEEVESDDSSEDGNHHGERAAEVTPQKPPTGLPNGQHSSTKQKGKAREVYAPRVVLEYDEDEGDEEEEEEDQYTQSSNETSAASTALTHEALLDAVPYSKFTPILDGEAKNVYVVENKRKRGKEALYFGLRHGETLVFLGIGHVEVLRGSVQMGGAVVSSTASGFRAADIYAPVSNPLPVLQSISAAKYPGQGAASGASQSSDGSDSDSRLDDMFESVFDTIVKVTPLSSPITTLGNACPIGGLATPFSTPPSLALSTKAHQLSTIKVLLAPDIDELVRRQRSLTTTGIFSTAGLSATYIPHKWQLALHNLSASALSAAQHPQEEAVVALVRGNKNVGKSTLSRMLLERLLSMGTVVGGKVAYLELDVGQSDFGPPGIVALHVFSLADNVKGETVEEVEVNDAELAGADAEDGLASAESEASSDVEPPNAARNCITLGPGWCQPRVPVRAHFFGDISPRDDPESYVAAVHDLIEYFRAYIQPGHANSSEEPYRVPLIVNSQGWVKGLGADLAARLEPMLRPTHIFDVVPRGSSRAVPPPTRGQPWLDAEGAILGSGPEIVTLESVSQLEYVQGAFGPQRDSNGSFKHQSSNAKASVDQQGPGDGGSNPPRFVTEVGSKLVSAEARLLNVMSYLYATQLVPAGPGKVRGSWDFSEPLLHRPPMEIDVKEGLRAGIRVLAFGSSVPDTLKLMALNSSIVAIVVTDATEDPEEDPSTESVSVWKQAFNRAATAHALASRCIGLGIVRSIDPDSGRIHLLTPIDPSYLHVLGGSIGLVKGALELPVWASLDFDAIKEARESRLNVTPTDDEQLMAGMPRNQVPYVEWPHSANPQLATNGKGEAGVLGAGKRRVRRNLMRKSQFV